jgi:hypothetical protein
MVEKLRREWMSIAQKLARQSNYFLVQKLARRLSYFQRGTNEKIGRSNLGHLTSREWIMRMTNKQCELSSMTNKQCELQAVKQKRLTICYALQHKPSWTGLNFVIETGNGELIP